MNVSWQLLHEKQDKTIAELKQTIHELQQLVRDASTTESAPTGRPMTTQGLVAAQDNVVRGRVSSACCDDDVETLQQKCNQLETIKTEVRQFDITMLLTVQVTRVTRPTSDIFTNAMNFALFSYYC